MKTGRAGLFLLFLLVRFSIPGAATGRLTLSPYLDYGYSSNIFWDSSQVGDSTLSPGLGLDYASGSIHLFLSADGRLYRRNDQLNSSTLSGGVGYFRMFSKRDALFVSPDLSLVQFQGDMAFMNALIPSVAIGVKHVFSDHLFGRLGVSLRHSDYLNEDSYDRLRLAAFWEMSAFFRTQTTVRCTLGMNYLLFPHVTAWLPAAVNPVVGGQAAAAVPAGGDDRYRRGSPTPTPPDPPAPPKPPEPPTPPVPPSPPEPPAPDPETPTSLVAATIDMAIPQPYVVLRVAQGIGFRTGLVAEILYRRNQRPLQGIQALTAAEWTLEQMDEDFFWEGTRLTLGVKTESFLGLEIAVDASAYSKRYQGIAALDLEGDPIQPAAFRSDTLTQVNVSIRRAFGRLGISLTGSLRKNDSNDPYFRYDYVSLTCGLGYSL